MKKGDRVQHDAGWLGVIEQMFWSPYEIEVKADDKKLSGTYSPTVFTVVDETERVMSND